MSGRRKFALLTTGSILCGLLALLDDSPAYASHGDGLPCCGQPLTCETSDAPTAVDCLFILNAAVGLQSCDFCDCDTDGTSRITASDSLTCLHGAIGLPFARDCCHFSCPSPECPTTSTTTITSTTSTTTTTTTTIPQMQDPRCPNKAEMIVHAGTSGTSCSSNEDCIIGTCDTDLSLCVTDTEADLGWTGNFHGHDLNDLTKRSVELRCPGPFDALSSEPCGECEIAGLLSETGDCRCANDNRTVCDEPFAADADDCGGDICNCYMGPPIALGAANSTKCVVNRYASDVSGTVNVDEGSGTVSTQVRAVAYHGESLPLPCPACGGTCTAPTVNLGKPCTADIDCDSTAGDGVCANYDGLANDGLREGTCVRGLNEGELCDVGAYHGTFPAPGPNGSGMSLDCFPDQGKNISGTGLPISLTQTTGTSALPPAGIECGFPPYVTFNCPCGLCSDDGTPCSSNSDCGPLGACASGGTGQPLPNQCGGTEGCTDIGHGEGRCTGGPIDTLCDGLVRADGTGLIACLSNGDCKPDTIGIDAGACTLEKTRECFLDPVTASGTPDPSTPISVATFCLSPASNAGTNTVFGIPGPARVRTQISAMTFCASASETQYAPGIGGCP